MIGEVPIDDPAAVPRAVGYGTFDAWRERAGSRATLEAIDGTNVTLTGLGAAERLTAANVTPGFFRLLGIAPTLGRSFDDDDVGRRVVIVTHGFWRGTLASDPGVVGREIVLGGEAHTIVGVLPERFFFALNVNDVWRPFPVPPTQAARLRYRVGVIGRVAAGVSPADLGQSLDEVSRTGAPPARVATTRIATAITGRTRGTLGLLAAAAAIAMLIAFTNLAGLLLVRSIDRRRELAVRCALGAGRREIARQLLLEALALVVLGIVGGVLLAWWLTPVVARLALQQFGGIANAEVVVSWRVIGIIATLASACAVVCALLPAFLSARQNVVDALRRGVTAPPRERALRRVFVAGEVALAFVLLVSVTLVGRSLFSVLSVNPGFEPRGLLLLQVSLPAARYADAKRVASFYSTLQSALEERLGPRAISIVDEIPLTGDRGRTLVSIRSTDAGREAVVRAVHPGYVDVMRIPLIAGRSFDRRDTASAPLRIMVSESLAARLFPFEQPIGRHVELAGLAPPAEIIGLVSDVKHRALDETALPTVYLSALQQPSNSSIIVVRSTRLDADVIATVRDEVARLDADLPVYGVRPMEEVVAASPGVPVRRVLTAAFTGSALLALVLGIVGLFGVMAHEVASRRGELALRVALGASPRRIRGTTLGHGAVIVATGLIGGAVLSLWASRALAQILIGIGPIDVLSVAVATAVLTLAGAGAVFPAAQRAARTDPLIALRAE
jgi:putative ABC transport system permease protein